MKPADQSCRTRPGHRQGAQSASQRFARSGRHQATPVVAREELSRYAGTGGRSLQGYQEAARPNDCSSKISPERCAPVRSAACCGSLPRIAAAAEIRQRTARRRELRCFRPAVMTFAQFAERVLAASDRLVQPISDLVKQQILPPPDQDRNRRRPIATFWPDRRNHRPGRPGHRVHQRAETAGNLARRIRKSLHQARPAAQGSRTGRGCTAPTRKHLNDNQLYDAEGRLLDGLARYYAPARRAPSSPCGTSLWTASPISRVRSTKSWKRSPTASIRCRFPCRSKGPGPAGAVRQAQRHAQRARATIEERRSRDARPPRALRLAGARARRAGAVRPLAWRGAPRTQRASKSAKPGVRSTSCILSGGESNSCSSRGTAPRGALSVLAK